MNIRDFTFKSWNLAEAKLGIEHALKKRKEFNLSENEVTFLERISELIGAAVNVIKQGQTIAIPDNKDEYDLKSIVDAYIKQHEEAYAVVIFLNQKLLKRIEKELRSTYRSKQFPSKHYQDLL